MKVKTVKLLEPKVGEIFYELVIRKDFLEKTKLFFFGGTGV
jgi:hypothetical protein